MLSLQSLKSKKIDLRSNINQKCTIIKLEWMSIKLNLIRKLKSGNSMIDKFKDSGLRSINLIDKETRVSTILNLLMSNHSWNLSIMSIH